MAETHHEQRVFSTEVQPRFELRPQWTHFDGLVDESGADIKRGRLQREALVRATGVDPASVGVSLVGEAPHEPPFASPSRLP